jgi:hypothetical protein
MARCHLDHPVTSSIYMAVLSKEKLLVMMKWRKKESDNTKSKTRKMMQMKKKQIKPKLSLKN